MYKTLITFCFLLFFVTITHSQDIVDQALQYIAENQNNKTVKLENEDFSDVIITDRYTSNGIEHIYLNQAVNGVALFGHAMNITAKDGKVVYVTQNFTTLKKLKVKAEVEYDIHKALQITSKLVESNYTNDWLSLRSESGNRWIGKSKISKEDIFYELAYTKQGSELIPIWLVGIYSDKESKWWQFHIHPKSGKVLNKISWTTECNLYACNNSSTHHTHTHTSSSHIPTYLSGSINDDKYQKYTSQKGLSQSAMTNTYEVFALPLINPDEGGRTIEANPWNVASNASPFGWHDTDGSPGEEYIITRGNNVYASEDVDADDNPGYAPSGGITLDFQFPFSAGDFPVNYQDAAITNLFYWNNVMHDVWYQYGFDEPSGNFQDNNYGNGGAGSDFVNADAQDGSSTNNANFSTPPDGTNPRMQMFEWNVNQNISISVTNPPAIAGFYAVTGANFGPQLGTYSGTLVDTNPTDACVPINNGAAINGNIALIDRGNCTFADKVNEAQTAGAVAVLVCNNVAGSPIYMGGTDPNISIPSIMISQSDCATIRASLPGVDISFTLNGSSVKDSDLDNGVIAHEYGHGISTRLTGGPGASSCLFGDEQMGEGWSDWFALMVTMKTGDVATDARGMGTYLRNQPTNGTGIRAFPYTTDMTINPHTYDDIKSSVIPHGVGSVWAAMLWEVTWDLIGQYSFDANIYAGTGGNNIAMALVIEALKLQPCNPGFTDGRDAILAADQLLYAGANECLIWNAFARRGLGYSAVQGSSGSRSDGTEAFDLPPVCNNELVIEKTGPIISTLSAVINYFIEVTNYTGANVTNVKISDMLPTNLTYINGSLNQGAVNGNNVTYSQVVLIDQANINLNFDVNVNANTASTMTYYEDFEYDYAEWIPSSGQGTSLFQFTNNNPYRGTGTYFVANVGANNTQYLTFSGVTLPANALLSFYHDYDTEENWDGGVVEISTNGGISFFDVGSSMVMNGYNTNIGTSSNTDIGGRSGFSGNSNGYIRTIVDLSVYGGQNVDLRFMYGSDDNTFSTGWYIDEIMIYDALKITNTACVVTAQGNNECGDITTIVLPDCELYNRYFADVDGDGFGDKLNEGWACTIPFGFVIDDTDCDDSDASNYPGGIEICDGIDNNCNGIIDDGCINVCPPNYSGTNAISGANNGTGGTYNNDDYETDGDIESTQIINAGTVDYDSKTGVLLNIGFEVNLGAIFTGFIDGCNNGSGGVLLTEDIEESKDK